MLFVIFFVVAIRESAKKVLVLMAGPLRPPPPNPSLMAVGTKQQNKVKVKKKILNGPAIKIRTFFCSFP